MRRSRQAPRPRTRGVDRRWLVGGISVAVIAAIALFAIVGGRFGDGNGGKGASTSGVAVGQVTEASLAGTSPATALLRPGTPAPDLRWRLEGQDSGVAALRGTPLLLEFFATWCPHCQAEAPVLSRISQRYAARGLKVIAVNSSPVGQDQRARASEADVRSYAAKYGAIYPHLMDPGLVGAQRYGIRSFPTLYLVDRSGVIRLAQSGEVPENMLTEAVEGILVP